MKVEKVRKSKPISKVDFVVPRIFQLYPGPIVGPYTVIILLTRVTLSKDLGNLR